MIPIRKTSELSTIFKANSNRGGFSDDGKSVVGKPATGIYIF